VNGPWNQINVLLSGFNKTNFGALWDPTWMVALAILVITVIFYNFQNRRLHAYSVFLDLNEWLMWTSVAISSLLLMYAVFNFDFLFVLPTMLTGAVLFIWIRFIHFPPLIQVYEERLARQRYFQRAKTSHPETTIRSRPATVKPKRRRR
jgi:membrane-associated HD superfamily phosphohydrolase